MTNIVTLPTRPDQLGRYEILAEIGRGSMGVVYKARDPIIDRIVAIKIINAGLVARGAGGFEERFFREARSAGRLNHPNIVTIYDAGKAGAVPYIAMELLDGRSLRELLDSGERLPLVRVLDIGLQAVRGLAYAHDHGIVHRDVKPANLILLRNGLVKLTDFGIARVLSAEATMSGEVVGSPKYMSPEQIRGGDIDGRTDIFALGALLYELLTGVSPFEAESLSAIMYKVLEHTPPPPSRLNAEVPAELDAIIARMLARDVAERYPDGHAIERELRSLRRRLPDAADADDHVAPTPVTPVAVPPSLPPSAANDGDATVRVPPPVITATAVPSRRRMRITIVSGVAVVAALVVGVALMLQSPKRGAPAAIAAAPSSSPASANEPSTNPAVTSPTTKPAVPAASSASGFARMPALTPVADKAVVAVAVAPWGDVYVDGEMQGTASPRFRLTLEPGRHRIEIRNGRYPPHLVDIAVKAGETRTLNHRFE